MNVSFERKDGEYLGEERCFNTACLSNGYTKNHSCDNNCEYTRVTEKCKNFKGEKSMKSQHKVGTIFSAVNEKEAEAYIGRIVEFIDNQGLRRNESWVKGIFKNFTSRDQSYPFRLAGGEYFHLIRLITESFEEPKPKVDPGLIAALKLSIQQWQIMHDTGKGKSATYGFLSGKTGTGCFLCDFSGRIDDSTGHCHKCIDWKASYCYQNSNSPFYTWRENQCTKTILQMLNHLKSELVRLESLSK